MKVKESKDDTYSLMKVATDFMFTQLSTKASIKKFGDKAVVDMVKGYRQIYKGAMEGKPVFAPIDPDTLWTIVNRYRWLTL